MEHILIKFINVLLSAYIMHTGTIVFHHYLRVKDPRIQYSAGSFKLASLVGHLCSLSCEVIIYWACDYLSKLGLRFSLNVMKNIWKKVLEHFMAQLGMKFMAVMALFVVYIFQHQLFSGACIIFFPYASMPNIDIHVLFGVQTMFCVCIPHNGSIHQHHAQHQHFVYDDDVLTHYVEYIHKTYLPTEQPLGEEWDCKWSYFTYTFLQPLTVFADLAFVRYCYGVFFNTPHTTWFKLWGQVVYSCVSKLCYRYFR